MASSLWRKHLLFLSKWPTVAWILTFHLLITSTCMSLKHIWECKNIFSWQSGYERNHSQRLKVIYRAAFMKAIYQRPGWLPWSTVPRTNHSLLTQYNKPLINTENLLWIQVNFFPHQAAIFPLPTLTRGSQSVYFTCLHFMKCCSLPL